MKINTLTEQILAFKMCATKGRFFTKGNYRESSGYFVFL